jgi:hypothetical protein
MLILQRQSPRLGFFESPAQLAHAGQHIAQIANLDI